MWPGILLASLTILDASRHQHGGRLLVHRKLHCPGLGINNTNCFFFFNLFMVLYTKQQKTFSSFFCFNPEMNEHVFAIRINQLYFRRPMVDFFVSINQVPILN